MGNDKDESELNQSLLPGRFSHEKQQFHGIGTKWIELLCAHIATRKLLVGEKEQKLLVNSLITLLGVVLGGAAAYLITHGSWPLAVAIVCVAPAVILLNQYPIITFMFWLLIIPFLPTDGSITQVWWVLHRGMMFMALMVTVLVRMLKLKKYPPTRLGLPELSMAIYLVVTAASILLTRSSPLVALYELYDRYFVPFVAYWLIRFVQPDEKDLKRLTLFALVLYIGEIILGFWVRSSPGTLPAFWAFERMGQRMSGSFTNPNVYAYILLLAMVFLSHYVMNQPHRIVRYLFLLLFCLGIVCIFLTSTRACWVAAIFVLLGLIILYPNPFLWLAFVSIPVIILPSMVVFADEFDLATRRLNTQDTVDSRIMQMRTAETMFAARPIWGWGFAAYDRYDWKFMRAYKNYVPTWWDVHYGTSHHTYLTILAETGIVGFLFQFFPVIWWFVLSVKALPRLPGHGFRSWRLLIVLWLPIVVYLIIAQFIDMRFFWYAIGMFWATLGLVANLVQPMENDL